MSIYDLIESINDTYNIIFRLFDCNREDLVWVETDEGAKTNLDAQELMMSEFINEEIGSMDMWIDNGTIYIEINIEIEEEE
jgi:hypothetical protein